MRKRCQDQWQDPFSHSGTNPVTQAPYLNETTTKAYDADGNVTSVTDAISRTVQYSYDGLGRKTQVADANAGTTTYQYDADNDLTALTDPQHNTTTFQFDGLDRETTETIVLPVVGAVSRTRVYDASSNLSTETDRDGRMRQFSYDGLNRVTQEQWLGSLSRIIAFQYDAGGNLLSVVDPDSTCVYTYDGLGRMLTESNAGTAAMPTVVWTNTYDAAGNLFTQSDTINNQPDATTTYTADGMDRVVREVQSVGSSAKRVDITYDADSEITHLNRDGDSGGANIVVSSTAGYNAAGEMTSLSYQHSSTTLADYTWSYDAANQAGGRSSQSHPDVNDSYGYDLAGELTSATDVNQAITYDKAGNRTNGANQTNPYNQLASDGTYRYAYDNEGNLITRTNIGTNTFDTYTWDYRNRLTDVVTKNSSNTVLQTVHSVYDSHDQRIGKLVTAGGTTTTERDVYIGGQLALVFDGNGMLKERYLYGPNVDQALAVDRSGTVQWLLGDSTQER